MSTIDPLKTDSGGSVDFGLIAAPGVDEEQVVGSRVQLVPIFAERPAQSRQLPVRHPPFEVVVRAAVAFTELLAGLDAALERTLPDRGDGVRLVISPVLGHTGIPLGLGPISISTGNNEECRPRFYIVRCNFGLALVDGRQLCDPDLPPNLQETGTYG